ncbi:hypothetical protein VNO80_25315 [Phaseolus coccineus]|uniref:Uncharacterized protein n=1 Tax=Phaseolus coccineus TaxID=3886 RepID=A0AAN9QQ10_PHACN
MSMAENPARPPASSPALQGRGIDKKMARSKNVKSDEMEVDYIVAGSYFDDYNNDLDIQSNEETSANEDAQEVDDTESVVCIDLDWGFNKEDVR